MTVYPYTENYLQRYYNDKRCSKATSRRNSGRESAWKNLKPGCATARSANLWMENAHSATTVEKPQ